ncbi:MAG: purine-nucleoside phosphorylase [bacterium]
MQESIDFIKSKTENLEISPTIGIILGSGLCDFADEIKGISIPYTEIPKFETSTIKGHTGNLVIGKLSDKSIIAMQGRLHFYEGYSMSAIVYPVKIMKKLGINTLIVTNAAGGINDKFNPGDLMIIKDHINLMGNNPLIGKTLDDEFRFLDMSNAYSKDLISLAKNTAKDLKIKLKKGIYAGVTGPVYETPAEIRMFKILGADAVGMSTVPEVIEANYLGIKVLGISCIANITTNNQDKILTHDEVIETTAKAKQDFIKLIKTIIEKIN